MTDIPGPLDHRTSPPATALGPDDGDEPTVADTDEEEAVDAVEQFLDPGQPADDTTVPPGS